MKMNIKSIEGMIAVLKSNPYVLGLVEYGSSTYESIKDEKGDYDLFVILKDEVHDVESLHFRVATIPVDLNIRSIQQIQNLKYAEGFEAALLDGRIIYDPTEKVTQALKELRERHETNYPDRSSEHAIAFTRHGHKHVLSKIKGGLDEKSLLTELLLNTNIYWLVMTYFNTRNLLFQGEKHALDYLRENEPEIYQGIEDFYSVEDRREKVKIQERLTDLVLKPVGGKWKDDEILAFGDTKTKDLQIKGEELYQRLFYRSSNK